MGISKITEGERARRILLWLGFGLFVVTYSGGPLGFISGSVQREEAWAPLLLVQSAFMVGTALGCWFLTRFAHLAPRAERQVLGAGAYAVVTLLCLALQPVLATSEATSGLAVRSLLSLLAGVFYGQPLLFWVERFSDLSRSCGRFVLLALLVCCYLLSPMVMAVTSLFDGIPFAFSLAMMGCAAVAAALQVAVARHGGPAAEATTAVQGKKYRLTVYSSAVLVGLGFTWGVAEAASLYVLGGDAPVQLALTMIVTFSVLIAVAMVVRSFSRFDGVRFGMIIRLSLVACGAVMAALPLLGSLAPTLLSPLCYFVTLVGELSLIVFSIDICREEGMPLAPVFSAYYGVFVGTLCAAGAFFWIAQMTVPEEVAWLVSAMVATWAVLAVIPFLPSRSSNAAVLTLSRLPENEGYEANVHLRRETAAARYGLSEGEAEVLGHLLQGKKRDEIAEAMYLSPWTIKARTSAIYKKCGVHSYKELMVLVASDE